MRCRAFHEDKDLVCDLDEHDVVLKFHYDAIAELEWRHPLVPVGVPLTRTKPVKTGSVPLPRPAGFASAGTSEFEVIHD